MGVKKMCLVIALPLSSSRHDASEKQRNVQACTIRSIECTTCHGSTEGLAGLAVREAERASTGQEISLLR